MSTFRKNLNTMRLELGSQLKKPFFYETETFNVLEIVVQK